MGTLAAALAWAARGFRIFPLEENSKLPREGDIGWTTWATTDPEIIEAWWTDPVTGAERNWNIGFQTDGWIVSDVDVKEGKRGLQTFSELGMEWDTLTIATPSGGYHLVYENEGKSVGQNPLGRDVDIRSFHGYVVAPGSIIEGREYRVVIDLPPARFPDHLRDRLQRPRERPQNVCPSVDLDRPEFVETARQWLECHAPIAIEGAGGDDTTFRVAARLRDFGLSSVFAFDLLSSSWNERCAPPWEEEELRRKVENAYLYATGSAGSATPQASFDSVTILDPPSARYAHGPNGTPYHFGNLMAVGEIVTRPWVLGTLLMNRTVTTLVAGPGAGKSMLKLIIAAHLAVGKDFMGHKCYRAGKAIIFDAEDDVIEMSRRLNAICWVYGLDLDTVRKNVCLVSSDELLLQLTTSGSNPVINKDQVEHLIQTLSDPEVVMLAVGPLAELHGGNENDNIVMRYVMGILRLIAVKGDVSVLVDHHTAKPPISSSEVWVGSQFAGRGASAIPAAARCVLTLFAASTEDCLELGVPSKDRGQFVRLDTGKMSYAKPPPTQWLRWQSVRLWNGDEVGVLGEFRVEESLDRARAVFAQGLASALRSKGSASCNVDEALGVLMRDPLVAKEGRATARNRLERMLAEPIRIDGSELSLIRGPKGLEGVSLR